MARGRAKWKRALDPKTHLARVMVRLEAAAPAVTGAIGYHSLLGLPSRFETLREARVASRIQAPRYADAFRTLSLANVDSPTGQLGHPGHADLGPLPPLETRRVAATLRDVLVPGHALLPVDAATGRLLAVYGREGAFVNWGLAYPALSALRRLDVPGFAWAVPPARNYFHLLVEHVLPVLDELIRNADAYRGAPISMVAAPNRLAIARYFAGVLAEFGTHVSVIVASPFMTYRPQFYLFCKPVSASVEHLYGFAETSEAIGDALRARRRRSGWAPDLPERLYIPRTGTRLRRLEAEDRLVAALDARGFSAFAASWSNIERQVEAFMAAREVVSVHGAALTNMIWAGRDARLVELFPVNARKTTYLHMASQRDQAYDCVIGGPEDGRQSFAVDPQAVADALR